MSSISETRLAVVSCQPVACQKPSIDSTFDSHTAMRTALPPGVRCGVDEGAGGAAGRGRRWAEGDGPAPRRPPLALSPDVVPPSAPQGQSDRKNVRYRKFAELRSAFRHPRQRAFLFVIHTVALKTYFFLNWNLKSPK